VQRSNGEYEVHYIGVNWPHHIFVNQDFNVVGADWPPTVGQISSAYSRILGVSVRGLTPAEVRRLTPPSGLSLI
jgi:hypothetical protein